MDDTIADLNLLPLAERELSVGTFSRIGLSVAIFAGAIGLSMTGFPMTIAFLGAVLAYILCGICRSGIFTGRWNGRSSSCAAR